MWKPIGLIAISMLLIGFATCTVQRTVIHSARDGTPLDIIGDIASCPSCGSYSEYSDSGYQYKCRQCGREFRARWKAAGELPQGERRTVEYDW